MVGTVDQLDSEIDHRIASQRAASGGVFDSLLDRRAIVLRDRTAEDFVDELEPAAARQRFEDAFAIAELAAAAGLFLVTALHLDPRLNRFAIGHLRLMQLDF